MSEVERKCRNCQFFLWSMFPESYYQERKRITELNNPSWSAQEVHDHANDYRNWELKKQDTGNCAYHGLGPLYDHFSCDNFKQITFVSHQPKVKEITFHDSGWTCSRRNNECYCFQNQEDPEGCFSAVKKP